jgi:hypothetical protein
MSADPYEITRDLSGLEIGEYGLINPAPFYWPETIECNQCEEACFEEVGYRAINGIVRAFIGCNKGGRVNVSLAMIENEMNKG